LQLVHPDTFFGFVQKLHAALIASAFPPYFSAPSEKYAKEWPASLQPLMRSLSKATMLVTAPNLMLGHEAPRSNGDFDAHFLMGRKSRAFKPLCL
jgi:hypothetical protein